MRIPLIIITLIVGLTAAFSQQTTTFMYAVSTGISFNAVDSAYNMSASSLSKTISVNAGNNRMAFYCIQNYHDAIDSVKNTTTNYKLPIVVTNNPGNNVRVAILKDTTVTTGNNTYVVYFPQNNMIGVGIIVLNNVTSLGFVSAASASSGNPTTTISATNGQWVVSVMGDDGSQSRYSSSAPTTLRFSDGVSTASLSIAGGTTVGPVTSVTYLETAGSYFYNMASVVASPTSIQEFITNGEFTTDTDGWDVESSAAFLASVTGGVNGNCLRVTNNGAVYGYARYAGGTTTEIGETYILSFYHKNGTATGFTSIGSFVNGNDIYNSPDWNDVNWMFRTTEFVATTTTTWLKFGCDNATNAYTTYYDIISLKKK